MKKFIKPLAFLFAIAVTTGAYAQQDQPTHPIKEKLKMKEMPAKRIQSPNHKAKAKVVSGRDAHIQRIIREQGITVMEVK